MPEALNPFIDIPIQRPIDGNTFEDYREMVKLGFCTAKDIWWILTFDVVSFYMELHDHFYHRYGREIYRSVIYDFAIRRWLAGCQDTAKWAKLQCCKRMGLVSRHDGHYQLSPCLALEDADYERYTRFTFEIYLNYLNHVGRYYNERTHHGESKEGGFASV